MWPKLGAVLVAGLAVLWLARRDGIHAAKLAALKAEAERAAKEQERKNEMERVVDNLPITDVRQRLQNTKHD